MTTNKICQKKITPATEKLQDEEQLSAEPLLLGCYIHLQVFDNRVGDFHNNKGSQQKVRHGRNGAWHRRYVESLLGHGEIDTLCCTTRERTVSRQTNLPLIIKFSIRN